MTSKIDFRVQRAAEVVRRGGVIAYPTEAVWGLGCDPDNADAVDHLLWLKQRDPDKGLILVAADMAQLAPYLATISSAQYRALEQSWPGPVTWLVPVTSRVPTWIRGRFSSVALRVSDHPLVKELCQAAGGPLVSTSANPSGLPPATTNFRARKYFGHGVHCYLNGPLGGRTKPSEIRNLVTGETLRAGGN